MTDALPLRTKLGNGTARIGIIGLGYVGLPLSCAFADAGFDVTGYDIDDHRVSLLQEGESYVDDITDDELMAALAQGFTPRATPFRFSECDAYVITVPTGMAGSEPDMSAVKSAANTIAEHATDTEALTIVSSTVYPGATKEVVAPILTDDRDTPMHLAMVPERLDPGSEYPFEDIPLVVGADTDTTRDLATTLFESIVTETHPVPTTETAELSKTLENTYRMINIALVNELVTLAEGLDCNVWDAIDAAATKPFGFQPFYPGPGVGGHCIPVDPQFLTWRAQELDTDVSFIDDAFQINERMPGLIADRLETMLRGRGIAPEEASIVALGAAYKPNVGDTRNSPALRVIDNLPDAADVTLVDPYTDHTETARQLYQSVDAVDLADADAVVLLVDHDTFDLHQVSQEASFVFDTRNAMPEDTAADVVCLGELMTRADEAAWQGSLSDHRGLSANSPAGTD